MKTPILLRADDGLHWYKKPRTLELDVESPDIEDGLYTAWDADGQVLDLAPLAPSKWRSFLGLRFVSVSPGKLSETGRYEPDALHTIVAAHLKEVCNYAGEIPTDLNSIIEFFCRLQTHDKW